MLAVQRHHTGAAQPEVVGQREPRTLDLALLGEPGEDFLRRYRDLVAARGRRIPLQHLIGTAAFGPVSAKVMAQSAERFPLRPVTRWVPWPARSHGCWPPHAAAR